MPGPDLGVGAPGCPSRLISISWPSIAAGVYMIRAPMSPPTSMTTVPGPDGPAAGSVIWLSHLAQSPSWAS